MASPPLFSSQGTVSDLLLDLPWPADFFSADDLPGFLDSMYVMNAAVINDPGALSFQISVMFVGEAAISIPGLDGVQLVIGGSLSDLSDIPIIVNPSNPGDPTPEGMPEDVDPLPDMEGMTFLTVQLVVSPSPALIFSDISLALRFSPDILAPADPNGGPVQISTTGSITIDRTFNVRLAGFDALNLSPALIGSSGIGISADGVELDLSRTDSPQGVLDAGFDASFLGIFLGDAKLTLPAGMLGAGSGAQTITLTNAAIGSGGVSGTAALAHEDPIFDPTTNAYKGDRASTLFGVPFWLSDLSITLKANAFVNASVNGEIVMPFFQQRLAVQIGFDGNGGLLVKVAGTPGNPLVSFTPVTGVTFQVLSLAVSEQNGKGLFKLNTKLVLSNVGGIGNWPSPEVDGLLIDSDGNVQIEGGWIDLPKQASLDIDGFKMELTKIGFGKEDDASGGHRWFGFSGALKLADGIKAGASVKGLRIALTEPPALSLDGVGVDFEIPNSLSITGSVSMTKDPSTGRRDFAGALKVSVIPITLTIDGQFASGTNPTTGSRYFGIFLQGDLPTGIPLGATGLAIYGLAGLYGQGLAPGKKSTEGWYENPDATAGWYKRSPVGITSLHDKWTPTDGAYAFGAGVTLGTYSDNGYEFSGALLLVLSFPGPTILIDGRANLFKKRAALSGSDPTFRALAVIQPSTSFLLGLDAHYKYKDSGELVDIKGSAEAFFNFKNADDWHIYLGRKDPKLNARIAAKLFKIFDVNGYFELTPRQLAMGAAFSFDKKYGFSSLNVHVQASMQTDATVSWHPNHFNGDLILDGSAQLQAFGHGVGVKAHADITGDVFEPLHLHGDFSVGISLPWPLPDIGATVSLDWQTQLTSPPALPLPLHDATIEHATRMLKWPIPRDPNNGALLPDLDGGDLELVGGGTLPPTPGAEQQPPSAAPRIPADSKVGLTFSRPINDAAQIGVNSTSVLPEFVGDPTATTTIPPNATPSASNQQNAKSAYSVYYELSSVALEKRVPAPASADPSDLTPRWVQIAAAKGTTQPGGTTQLFGAWAPVHPNISDPASNNEQLKLLVNAKTPYDYTSQQLQVYDTWFDQNTSGYPCQPLTTPDQKFCALFVDFQFILPDVKQINFTNPAFSVIWPEKAELPDSDADIPGGHGSRRSLGTVGTLAPDNPVQVIPPSGLNEVDIMVGTAQGLIDIVTVKPTPSMISGNVLTLDTAVLTIFNTTDPNADRTPGPSPTKTPGTFTFDTDGGLFTGDLTEVTFPPAASALNVDVFFGAHFPIVVGLRAGPVTAEPTQTAQIIAYTDDGNRFVQDLTEGESASRFRFTGVRILRLAFRTTGGAQLKIFTLHARTPVSAVAFAEGGADQFGPFEEVNGIIKVVGEALGLIKLGTPRRCEFTIMDICTPDRSLQLNRHTVQSLDLLREIDPIFEPQADYRMVVSTRRNSTPTPKNNDAGHANDKNKLVEQAYFHVVGPPGIEVPDQPVTTPPAAPGSPTGFEDLSAYVASTVPDSTPASDGKPVLPRAYYRSYDVAIYFNQPSAVEQMYRLARRDLTLRLFDATNSPVLDADGRAVVPTSRWDTAAQPTLTDAQSRWVGQVNQTSCHPTDIPKFDVASALTNQNLSGPAEIALLPETLYQARLVPALLHEVFENPIPGLVADGVHELERWKAVNGDPAQAGHWVPDSLPVLDAGGNPVIGPDGKPEKTTFVKETSGAQTALLYRGPLGAPEDANSPDQWTDYRASAQLNWSSGTVAFLVRRSPTGDQIAITFDRSVGNGQRTVTVTAGTNSRSVTDPVNLGTPADDVQVTVDCVGTNVVITQPGEVPRVVLLDPGEPMQGTIGCLAAGAAGCRFTELRVDDLRSNPATGQRFDYVTSRYVNFAHHLASFDDQTFNVPSALGINATDFAAHAAASLAVPAGGGVAGFPFGLPGPTDDEARAFDALELASLGADGRLRAPAAVEIANATHDQTITALLIRSPEPFQWPRTALVSNVLPGPESLGIPGDVKMVGIARGSTPPTESVTMVVRTARSLTGFEVQWRPVVDPSNPGADANWSTYYTFGTEPELGDGIGVQVFSGSSDQAPPREPGTIQRFVAADAASAVTVFPADGTGIELRLLDSAGTVVHQREFRPEGGISQQTPVNLIRKADGTAFFLFLTTAPPPGMRLDFVFTRNPGPGTGASPPPFPTLRQAGSDTAEAISLTFAIVAG